MTDQPAKRSERIQVPSIQLPFRSDQGSISNVDVWREDILEWVPHPEFPSTFYLVIDFGTEQALTPVADTHTYTDTGRVQIDLQPLRIETLSEWDPDHSEGLGPPVSRFVDLPTDLLGDHPGDEPSAGRPMVGWIPHPVSRRRS